jgi:hypothetical protein
MIQYLLKIIKMKQMNQNQLYRIFGPPSYNGAYHATTVQKRELNFCDLVLGIAAVYVIIKGVVYFYMNYQIVKVPTIVKSKKVKEEVE